MIEKSVAITLFCDYLHLELYKVLKIFEKYLLLWLKISSGNNYHLFQLAL